MAKRKVSKRKSKPIKLMVCLETASGIQEDVAIQATCEDDITLAVIDVIEGQGWSLRGGDVIRITEIED